MTHADRDHPGALTMPRSRGTVSGLILVLLGVWGALIPFVGPRFNFAYTPDQDWAWSSARGWLEVLPGAATVIGGLLLILAGNRVAAMLGGWLAVLAGAWFVVGGQVAPLLGIGSAGDPIAATDRKRAALEVSYFSGLGALIVFVGGVVLARTAVRLARDVEPKWHTEPAEAPRAAEEPAYVSGLHEPLQEPVREPVREPEVASDALTKPRLDPGEPKRRWRRQQSGAGAQGEAYLRWPHPQR